MSDLTDQERNAALASLEREGVAEADARLIVAIFGRAALERIDGTPY